MYIDMYVHMRACIIHVCMRVCAFVFVYVYINLYFVHVRFHNIAACMHTTLHVFVHGHAKEFTPLPGTILTYTGVLVFEIDTSPCRP